MLKNRSSRWQQQRGLSLIEMMVGMTVGMIVVAGASVMMVNQLDDHRRLVLETQVQQDLRAVADLVLRDMRRAGYRRRSHETVWAPGAADPVKNDYAAASFDDDEQELLYSYSTAKGDLQEDGVAQNNEKFGYRLQSHVLQFRHGGSWQPLTDPGTLKLTAFVPEIVSQQIVLDEFCQRPCPVGGDCPPRMTVRELRLTLTGEATHDARVVRSVTVSARLRNDAIQGGC